jgi:hypothetical protein
MLLHTITSGAGTVAIATLLSFAPAQAAMSPTLRTGDASVQRVDCAVGFHIGPAGACIIGTDDHAVVEHRATDEGCETKSVTRTDDTGTVTKTKTNCN